MWDIVTGSSGSQGSCFLQRYLLSCFLCFNISRTTQLLPLWQGCSACFRIPDPHSTSVIVFCEVVKAAMLSEHKGTILQPPSRIVSSQGDYYSPPSIHSHSRQIAFLPSLIKQSNFLGLPILSDGKTNLIRKSYLGPPSFISLTSCAFFTR